MTNTLYVILKKRHIPFWRRVSLAIFFIKVRLIRLLVGRVISDTHYKTLTGIGLHFHINSFGDFYWTFKEIFIDEEYYFRSDEAQPFVLDCGGHIGLATLYFKWLYPDARVVVFEPLPENYQTLQQNIDGNGLADVKVVQSALSDTDGHLSFTGDGRAGHVATETEPSDLTVAVGTLSPFIDGPVAFCKMDIEGSEEAVIKELVSVGVLSQVQHLVMEYHRVSKNSLGAIIAQFERHDFYVSFHCTTDPLQLKKRDFTHIMLIATRTV